MKNLGEKCIDCIFIGYAKHSKFYRFYVIETNDYVSVNSIIESRDAIFDEERFTSIPRPREQEKLILLGLIFNFIWLKERGIRSQCKYCFILEEDPRTLSEAIASRDAAFWKEAVQSEIDSIMHNDTWELINLPPGCKWILKRKMKVDESIDKYKARLVIQGFRQNERIDFFDNYTPVAKITTIRLLLALVAINDLVIYQMDLKIAFLNGDLDEEIYMKQPKGFVMPGHENKICKLKKSLYGTSMSQLEYSRAIRCLMYAMISTRSDIGFVVGKLS
nr:zinc finger, CCHC-type [Tanacetum cinerariifolium]